MLIKNAGCPKANPQHLVAITHHQSPQEAEAEESWGPGQPQLYSELKGSLGFTRPCLQTWNKIKDMHILTLPFAFKIFLKNMLRAVELAQQLEVPARGVSQTFNYSSRGSSA